MSTTVQMPLSVESARINWLLGRAVIEPENLKVDEIREIAESVLFHVLRKQIRQRAPILNELEATKQVL